MKYRFLLFLLPVIFMASCSIFGAGFIEFIGSGNIEGPTCWIKVTGESSQRRQQTFFNSPSFHHNSDGLGLIFLIPQIFNDEFNDVIYHQVQTQVTQYAVTNQGYWFKLRMSGFRTASIHSSVFEFHEGDPEIYRFEDDIFAFQQWVNIRDVHDVDAGLFDNNCLSLIEAGEFESLGIEQEFFCEIIIATETAELRVGPGIERAIRSIAEHRDYFNGIGQVEVNGQVWYEVQTQAGDLWVSSHNVTFAFDDREDIPDAGCRDLPTSDSPPLVVQAVPQNNFASGIQNCSTFNILRPIGTVPAGESTYRWTPVDGVDQYILNFSDYQGNYVTSIVVDGSQTSVVVNTGSLATGSELSFEIVAMANGEVLCRTLSGPLIRTANFVAEEEEPTPEPTKEKKSGGGGYTPPSE